MLVICFFRILQCVFLLHKVKKRGRQAIELQGLSLNQRADCPRRQFQDYTQELIESLEHRTNASQTLIPLIFVFFRFFLHCGQSMTICTHPSWLWQVEEPTSMVSSGLAMAGGAAAGGGLAFMMCALAKSSKSCPTQRRSSFQRLLMYVDVC